MSKIEWTELTLNPTVGCDKVSEGCKECYAIRMAWRLMHSPHPNIRAKYFGTVEKTAKGNLNWTGQINFEESVFEELKSSKPKIFFVNSMSDLFHEKIPFSFIQKCFAKFEYYDNHTYQILTKRGKRMLEFYRWLEDTDPHLLQAISVNKKIWIGVSCENQKAADERIPFLLQVPAAIRFLSCEPLLGPIDLKKYYEIPHPSPVIAAQHVFALAHDNTNSGERFIKWVIVGGESGHNALPMHPEWAREIQKQCSDYGAAFFFKQWGEWGTEKVFPGKRKNIIGTYMDTTGYRIGFESLKRPGSVTLWKVGKKNSGRLLDGREWNEFPIDVLKMEETHAST